MARKGGSRKKPTPKPMPLPIEEVKGSGHYTQWTVPPTPKIKNIQEKEKAHEQE